MGGDYLAESQGKSIPNREVTATKVLGWGGAWHVLELLEGQCA